MPVVVTFAAILVAPPKLTLLVASCAVVILLSMVNSVLADVASLTFNPDKAVAAFPRMMSAPFVVNKTSLLAILEPNAVLRFEVEKDVLPPKMEISPLVAEKFKLLNPLLPFAVAIKLLLVLAPPDKYSSKKSFKSALTFANS